MLRYIADYNIFLVTVITNFMMHYYALLFKITK